MKIYQLRRLVEAEQWNGQDKILGLKVSLKDREVTNGDLWKGECPICSQFGYKHGTIEIPNCGEYLICPNGYLVKFFGEKYVVFSEKEFKENFIIPSEEPKIDIKEFREKGYLQEANRQFFHPLGLAMEVMIFEDGQERISGIQDYRKSPEGVYYNIKNSDKDRIERFKKNAKFIFEEQQKRASTRMKMFGGRIIEPIPEIKG